MLDSLVVTFKRPFSLISRFVHFITLLRCVSATDELIEFKDLCVCKEIISMGLLSL